MFSLEPRLSVPDFVSQLWRKIRAESQIWNGKPGFVAILSFFNVFECSENDASTYKSSS